MGTARPRSSSVFGPTIQPGFGTPIRKDQSEESKALVEGVQSVMAGVPKGGITARAILGDGDNRRENDAYYTPLEAITALLSVQRFEGLTWEPAEGDKRIVRKLEKIGCDVFGSDLATGTDFLQTHREVDNVVTNPPWDRER